MPQNALSPAPRKSEGKSSSLPLEPLSPPLSVLRIDFERIPLWGMRTIGESIEFALRIP
jgi:hypothetical protein